ncbi:MAG TPA: hypothetical protein PKE61_02125 [Burkholderiaceae bacterium]|nr:hypothetical protein [Burkholderiaceae bacterium]HNG78921.1 hypothetical protein [Burkholderiaceae bacterium]
MGAIPPRIVTASSPPIIPTALTTLLTAALTAVITATVVALLLTAGAIGTRVAARPLAIALPVVLHTVTGQRRHRRTGIAAVMPIGVVAIARVLLLVLAAMRAIAPIMPL